MLRMLSFRRADFATTIILLLLAANAMAQQTHDWRPLLQNGSLQGWEHIGPGRFVIEEDKSPDAKIVRTQGGMGLLWYTREKFGDCIIRVVYKATNAKSNAGVFVRIADRPADPMWAVHHGYEVQIQDDNDPYHRTGAIYSLAPVETGAAKPGGEWNVMDIELRGDVVNVTLNGKQITHFDPSKPSPKREHDWEPERGPRPTHGYIGLQNHSGEDVVYFKEVSVKPLS
jgi:hypothetical protein